MTFKVLVFNEIGICPDSIDGLKRDLHLFLSPNYWIGDVDQAQLQFGKWVHTCALLVLPHYSNVKAYTRLGQDPEATKQIRNFVHNGGSFLGIGLGASFASAKTNWYKRTIWQEPLALWPGTSTGPWSSGDGYAHEFYLDIDGSPCPCHLFWKEGGQFEGFEGERGTSVLARYNDNESIAAIHYVYAQRNVVLWHARLEYALTAQVMQESGGRYTDTKIELAEQERRELFERTLQTLRLQLTEDNSTLPPRLPFPQLLVALPNPTQPGNPFVNLSSLNTLYNGENATFKILPAQYAMPQKWATLKEQSQSETGPWPLIWVVSPHRIPQQDVTPLFNIGLYFIELVKARRDDQVSDQFGRYLLYGEAVTSTHSQLIGNPFVARKLPSPLLSLATFQLNGICSSADRAWLSPYGVLQWTLMLDVPSGFGTNAHLDAVVHIVSLAVVEACRPLLDDEHRPRLGLKWPNDIYIKSEDDDRLEKVGGVLVELIPEPASEGTKRILIGCGLDVCNNRPLPALAQFARQMNGTLSMELVAARIMARLSIYWEQFTQNSFSFASFRTKYTNALLHKKRNARLITQHEETTYTINGVDDAGQLWITHTQSGDRFLPATGYSFDIHRSILYPRPRA